MIDSRRIARRRWLAFGCVASIATVSACIHTSPAPEQSVVRQLFGDYISLAIARGRGVEGELLAVTDSSFILMRGRASSQDEARGGQPTVQLAGPSGVVVVPRRAIIAIEFGLQRFDVAAGTLQPGDLRGIVQRSRFPYGISADAMTELLRSTRQTKPDTLVVPSP